MGDQDVLAASSALHLEHANLDLGHLSTSVVQDVLTGNGGVLFSLDDLAVDQQLDVAVLVGNSIALVIFLVQILVAVLQLILSAGPILGLLNGSLEVVLIILDALISQSLAQIQVGSLQILVIHDNGTGLLSQVPSATSIYEVGQGVGIASGILINVSVLLSNALGGAIAS